MTFDVFAVRTGLLKRRKEWRWRLRSDNFRIIANSGESYRNKVDCLTSIYLVRSADPNTRIREIDEHGSMVGYL